MSDDTQLKSLSLRLDGSLADAIYVALRDAICDGTLRPGLRLRELVLAEQFDVSTTPIREAIQRLDHEGLVKMAPRRGAAVTRMEWSQVRDLLEVRELLESAAVRKAAAHAPAELVAHAEQILRDAEAVIDDPGQQAFSRLDVEFHITLNRMSGNDTIRHFDELAQRQIQRARLSFDRRLPQRPKISHRQHVDILDAIKAGDPEGAEQALHRHVQSTGAALMNLFDQRTED